jgi:hypothetical protein
MRTRRSLIGLAVLATLTASLLSGCAGLLSLGASSRTVSCHYMSDALQKGSKQYQDGPTYVDDPTGTAGRVQVYADDIAHGLSQVKNKQVGQAGELVHDSLTTLADVMRKNAGDPQAGQQEVEFAGATVDTSIDKLTKLCTAKTDG